MDSKLELIEKLVETAREHYGMSPNDRITFAQMWELHDAALAIAITMETWLAERNEGLTEDAQHDNVEFRRNKE
jgi:hypothetical protein